MKVLITGVAGFIGSHVANYFIKHTNWDIIGIDGLTYASDVTRIKPNDRLTIYYHNLCSPLPKIECDYIINFASDSHVDKSIQDPIPFVLNNVHSCLNVLEFAKETKARLIQISTDEVYGPAPFGVNFKEYDSFNPSNPYSASKASQECLCMSYWRTYSVPVMIVNLMNVFGVGQHPEKFIPKCVKYLLEGKEVPVHAAYEYKNLVCGPQWTPGRRHWLYVDNVANALLFLIQHPDLINDYPESPRLAKLHVTGEQEIDNFAIMNKIAAILGVPAKFRWENVYEQRPGHDFRYALDGDKLRGEGWIPPYGFDESFEKVVLAEKERLQGPLH